MSREPICAVVVITSFLLGCTAATRVEPACEEGGCEGDTIGTPDAGPDGPLRDLFDGECGNGFDDDGDGSIDEGCSCSPLEEQSCYPGDPALSGVGVCEAGVQTCVETEDGPAWGPCEGAVLPSEEICDGIDSDCNGSVDDLESGSCETPVEFSGGECNAIPCPVDRPHPVGCEVTMQGSDSRGCAALTNGGTAVFFKEGNKCGVGGGISGTLYCSAVPGDPLDATNCPMNKSNPIYVASPSDCPD